MAEIKKAAAKQPTVAKKSEVKELAEAIVKAEAQKEEKKAAAKKPATKPAKKAAAKKPATKKAEPKKAEAAKKPAAKKTTTAKKPAAKKTTAAAPKAAEVKANIVLQYADKNVTFDTLVENAQNVYQYDMGKNVADMKKLDLYVKPEENTVYFVVNDKEHNQYGL